MNNTQILMSILTDESLEKYWSEINTKAIRVDQLQASRNVYLRLVALHSVKRDEAMSERKLLNVLNSLFP